MSISILTIDDRPEIKDWGLFSVKDDVDEEFYFCDQDTLLFDSASEIQQKTSTGKWILFINQFLACKDDEFHWLQDHAGIVLIKFLRMIGVNHHIVLVTPYSFECLINMDPGNLIIGSEGITLTKPVFNGMYDFSEYTEDKLKNLANQTFQDDLKPYVMVDYELPHNKRHHWANWWGIDRLWQIHFIIENDGSVETIDRLQQEVYPEALANKIKKIQNFQILYLHGQIDKLVYVNVLLAREKLFELKETLKDLHSELKNLDDKENNVENQIKKVQGTLDRLIEISSNFDEFNSELKKEINDQLDTLLANEGIETLEKKKKAIRSTLFKFNDEYSDRKKLEFKVQDQLNELEIAIEEIKALIPQSTISSKRKKLIRNAPRILYVDDQANEGWGEIFQHMLYGGQNRYTFQAYPKENEKIEDLDTFINDFQKAIERFNPEIILLDLRLKDERGTQINVENLSGAIVLKWLREKYSQIPVIITTASNKFWSYKELQQISNDDNFGYWAKEGIDVVLDEKESAMNYDRFLSLILEALESK